MALASAGENLRYQFLCLPSIVFPLHGQCLSQQTSSLQMMGHLLRRTGLKFIIATGPPSPSQLAELTNLIGTTEKQRSLSNCNPESEIDGRR